MNGDCSHEIKTFAPWKISYDSPCCSVTHSCPTLCNAMDWGTPGFPVHHQLPKLLKHLYIELVMSSNHLILCHSLLLLPSIFPCFSVFSKQLTLPIRWLKYWRFSFNISPSREHSGLISFRIDWFVIN